MRAGFIHLLRKYPGYRSLYLGRSISLLGDWLNALALLALLREIGANTASAIGAIFILKLLPTFLASPIVGVINDRHNRAQIMILSDIGRFLFVMGYLAVPFLPMASALVLLYSLIIGQAMGNAFFEPAYSSSIPNLVEKADLASANALSAMTWSLIFALGSGIGGILTEWFGWRIAILFDASTYLVSALMVSKIGALKQKKQLTGPQMGGRAAYAELFRYFRKDPEVLYVTFIKAAWCTAGALQLILSLFGERIYDMNGRPNLGTAVLFTTRALGTAVGPVIARRLVDANNRPKVYRTIWLSFVVAGSFYGLFGLVHNFWFALFSIFAAHIGGSIIWVYSTVLLQALVPDAFRGRVFSTENALAVLMICVMTYLCGFLVDKIHVQVWFLPRLVCVLVLLAGFILWFTGRKMVRHLETPGSQ